MKLSLDQREEYLEKNNPELEKSRNSLWKQNTRHEIFNVLSGKSFDTRFKINKTQTYHGIEETRRYKDRNFYLALQKIKEVKKVSKMHYKTHDKIIEIVKEMMALEEALNTHRPQIIRDEKGQWRFDFFWDWEKKKEENPSSSATSSIPLSTSPTMNTRDQQDWRNEDKDDWGPHSRIDDYYGN